MMQGDLFTARQQRDIGLASVADNNRGWVADAIELIRQLPVGATISADTLRMMCEDMPRHCNAFGAVFTAAARGGLVVHDGYVQATHPGARARRVAYMVRVGAYRLRPRYPPADSTDDRGRMTHIDLQSFCNPDKPELRTPFRVDDWAVASDGIIAVIVPIGRRAVNCADPAPWIAEAIRSWTVVPMTHSVGRQVLVEYLRRRRKPLAILGRLVYPDRLKRLLSVMTGPRVFFGLDNLHICIRSGDVLGVVLAQAYANDREIRNSGLRLIKIPGENGGAAKKVDARRKAARRIARSA